MSALPFFKRSACQADLAATDHTTLPSTSYSTTLPSPMWGTRMVPARVIRMCRNWPCVPVTVVGIGISFSILLVAMLMIIALAGFPFCMIRTRSFPMACIECTSVPSGAS